MGERRRGNHAIIASVIALGSLACGDGMSAHAPVTTTDELYDPDHVPAFHLTLGDEAIAALEVEPYEYVPGDFTYAGEVYEDVGIRLKGWGSFRPLDEKAAFKVKFNRYVSGQRFLGLESLTFNNMVQDPSYLHEYLGYRVGHALDVTAPRAGFADIFVNGERYGLYSNIETVGDDFLERHFADPSGPLYEGTLWDDIVPGEVADFELCDGEDPDRALLRAFAEAAANDTQALFDDPDSLLDVESFLSFTAFEAVIGHYDGYRIAHNFRIYYDPGRAKWTFIPWGIDQSLKREVDVFGGLAVLTTECMKRTSCFVRYLERVREAAVVFDELDLLDQIARALDIIQPSVDCDPRTPHSPATTLRARAELVTYIDGRSEQVMAMSECYADDSRAIDADIDGAVDGRPACPCPSVVIQGEEFQFCPYAFKWADASTWCQALGLELARIDNEEQNRELWEAAEEFREGEWFIGLRREEEGAPYLWPDESEPGFDGWHDDLPEEAGETNHCGSLSEGAWRDVHCGRWRPFICR